MPTFTYTVADFQPFTKIRSADVDSRFQDIADFLNGGIGNSNIVDNSLNRSTKLTIGTAGSVVINDGTGKMSEEAVLATSRGGLGFAPTISGTTSGKVLTVNNAGTSLELAQPSGATLIEQLAGSVPGILAGEGITANDAVSLILNNGIYKVVRCQSTDGARAANYWGFATNTATVTPQITTAVQSAAWTVGSITVVVNGRVYTQAFSSNNDTSMNALASQLAADPEVQSAAGSGSPVATITVTSKGGLSLVITSSSTGGAPTLTITDTQTATGQAVRVQMFGPLDGFTGMVTSDREYTSSSIGGISSIQSPGSIAVGQALSSTVLFVFPPGMNIQFGTSKTFIRSMGRSAPLTASSVIQTTEHFNGSSWAAGTASPIARASAGGSDNSALGLFWANDGVNSAGGVVGNTYSYDKNAWTSHAVKSNPNSGASIGNLNSFLYSNGGYDGTNFNFVADKFNLTSWSSGTAWVLTASNTAVFVLSSIMYKVGGVNSGGYYNNNETRTTADSVGSNAVLPLIAECVSASLCPNNLGLLTSPGAAASGSNSYYFNGSSWSAAISAIFSQQDSYANGQGYGSSGAMALNNGGSQSNAAISDSQVFNGVTYSSAASSSTASSLAVTGTA